MDIDAECRVSIFDKFLKHLDWNKKWRMRVGNYVGSETGLDGSKRTNEELLHFCTTL